MNKMGYFIKGKGFLGDHVGGGLALQLEGPTQALFLSICLISIFHTTKEKKEKGTECSVLQ